MSQIVKYLNRVVELNCLYTTGPKSVSNLKETKLILKQEVV